MVEPSLVVTKERGRKPRWRLKERGVAAEAFVKPGRVYLPPTLDENRRVREAVDAVLTGIARRQRAGAVEA